MSAPELRVFVQDSLLPAQFYAPPPLATPEQRMFLAILEEAHQNLLLGLRAVLDRKQRRIVAEAQAWVLDDDEAWPCAFVPLCRAVQMDPEAIRKAFRAQGLLEGGGPR